MKKVFYITTLIIGICLSVLALIFIGFMFYFAVLTIMKELNDLPPLQEQIRIILIIVLAFLILYGISYSPNLIKWSWKKLKE